MDALTIILLCSFAFLAGFVDAIVGGGGLIQTPAGLILLPQYPVATVIGSLKIPAFTGTAFAAKQYLKKVQVNWKQVTIMGSVAFMSAFAGSELLSQVSNRLMKPVIFVVLIGVALYTYTQKSFGQHAHKDIHPKHQFLYSLLISLVIGFYDGFIGPGAGSFLVLAFIGALGFDFLKAGAHAKLINLSTNLGSIFLFTLKGSILWPVAIPMAISNGIGGVLGAKLAIHKGNQFIRVFFLLVITATLLRFGYDIFFKS
ncbi:MAG TPA: TSUP family transporter [Sediminibacterium sp.]|nr:TSUP family transporter [Sediminibacterium sp.]